MFASWFMVLRKGEYTRRFRTLAQAIRTARYLWNGSREVEVRGLDEKTGYHVTVWRNGKWVHEDVTEQTYGQLLRRLRESTTPALEP